MFFDELKKMLSAAAGQDIPGSDIATHYIFSQNTICIRLNGEYMEVDYEVNDNSQLVSITKRPDWRVVDDYWTAYEKRQATRKDSTG